VNNRPTILVTRNIPQNGIDILKQKYTLIINKNNRPLHRNELKKNVKDVDGILCVLQDKIDKEIIDIAGPKLKVISTFSTGFEHIDINVAKERGIKIGYTGDILTETTADLAFGLILCIGRRITEADNFIRRSKWKGGWGPELMLGTDIYKKTIGLIGFGKIGQAIANRAKGFNMKILYHIRNKENLKLQNHLNECAKYCELDEIFTNSDYIVICCTFNKDSFHLINKENLNKMKNTSFLINIARGKIIKEKDLIHALKKKYIKGAALDVFEEEPISKNSPLIKMKNVVLVPHIGSASYETRNKMAYLAAMNIKYVLDGEDKKALLI